MVDHNTYSLSGAGLIKAIPDPVAVRNPRREDVPPPQLSAAAARPASSGPRAWGASSCGLIFFLLLLLGITPLQAGTNNSPAFSDLVLTAQDNGQTVNALVGQRIYVQLEGNPSTGYTWLVTTNGDSVVSTGAAEYTPYHPDLSGSSGIYRFPFKALKTGATVLQFAYRQPWNPEDPVSTFRVKIRVAEEIEGLHLILTAEQEARTVDASVGTRIFVQLEASVATGYEWLLIRSTGDSVVSAGNAVFTVDFPNLPGSSGFYNFPFLATKAGTTVLEFGYCPYGNPQNPQSTYTVTIRVVDALILTDADAGRTIDISVGERLLVEVEGNPSTPVRWFVTTNGDSVVSTGAAEFTPYRPGVPGTSGIYSFPFQAMKLGPTTLQFAYAPLSDPQNPITTFALTVHVVGPRLSIVRAGSKIEVRWPMASSYGYFIEGTARLSPPHWSAPNVLVQPDGTNYKIVLEAAGESLFFRLAN